MTSKTDDFAIIDKIILSKHVKLLYNRLNRTKQKLIFSNSVIRATREQVALISY